MDVEILASWTERLPFISRGDVGVSSVCHGAIEEDAAGVVLVLDGFGANGFLGTGFIAWRISVPAF